MTNITKVQAGMIQDSRGESSLVVTVQAGGKKGTFATPSGASTGIHEVPEVGIEKGKQQLTEYVVPALTGMEVEDQVAIDRRLLELAKKHALGGDVLIGTSVACAKAAAAVRSLEVYEYLATLRDIAPSQEVPYLFINLINGGAHAKNGGDIQEHWIIPGVQNAAEAYKQACEVQERLGDILAGNAQKGDEGGYVVPGMSVSERFHLLFEAVKSGGDSMLGADVAASHFYRDGMYTVDGKILSPDEYGTFLKVLVDEHNLLYLEDPFQEEDFRRFASLSVSKRDLTVIGDDLIATDRKRLEQAVQEGSIRAVIIKPNQVGTLSGTLDAMWYAREHDVHCIVSHRSGETMDTFIADLAYAFGCLGLKAGAPGQKERDVKYQRLIEISS